MNTLCRGELVCYPEGISQRVEQSQHSGKEKMGGPVREQEVGLTVVPEKETLKNKKETKERKKI